MTKTSPWKNYNRLKRIYHDTRMKVSGSVCSDWQQLTEIGSNWQQLVMTGNDWQ
jgi:hypothetical protein